MVGGNLPQGEERDAALAELSRKLRLLIDTVATEDGTEYSYTEIRDALAQRGHTLSRTSWHFMVSGTGRLSSNPELLRAIADIFGVDRDYLLPGSTGMPARITAQLEAVRRMRAEKVQRFAARTLGDMSPETVEAISRLLEDDERKRTS